MNTRLGLVAAATLVAATACHDRTNPNEQPSTPVVDASPAAPGGTSPSNAAGVDRGQQQQNDQAQNTAANGNGTMPSFLDLDMQHRGYLTEADVASNPNVSQRFKACDLDADGRLTKAEFDQCKPNP